MRATLQRDGEGKLGITAFLVRLANGNCPVTSTKSGSTVYKFEEFFKNYFQYTMEEIHCLKEEIQEFLRIIYEYIEGSCGRFGEVGIDFAIDNKGRLWFIECNAKAWKGNFISIL